MSSEEEAAQGGFGKEAGPDPVRGEADGPGSVEERGYGGTWLVQGGGSAAGRLAGAGRGLSCGEDGRRKEGYRRGDRVRPESGRRGAGLSSEEEATQVGFDKELRGAELGEARLRVGARGRTGGGLRGGAIEPEGVSGRRAGGAR